MIGGSWKYRNNENMRIFFFEIGNYPWIIREKVGKKLLIEGSLKYKNNENMRILFFDIGNYPGLYEKKQTKCFRKRGCIYDSFILK